MSSAENFAKSAKRMFPKYLDKCVNKEVLVLLTN